MCVDVVAVAAAVFFNRQSIHTHLGDQVVNFFLFEINSSRYFYFEQIF